MPRWPPPRSRRRASKFQPADLDITPQLSRLKAAGADTLFLVGNVGPSAQVVKSLDRMGWKVPVVSHWKRPAAHRTGRPQRQERALRADLQFLRQAGAGGRESDAGAQGQIFGHPSTQDITPAVGVANAYDGMQLAALAITQAGSTDGDAVRQGFYKIGKYDGLIKTYEQPFTPASHDALREDDYVWTHFVDNRILPVKGAQ
ncbi:ABC transporter substrate-binding protein [Achromobacter insuavis]